jgi:transposase
LISERTAVINQIRSFLLERGIPVRQGLRFLRQQLPEILAKRIDVLSPRMIRIVEDLSGDWRRLDERIECVTEEIEVLAHGTESCRQLMTIPGIGPIIASAMVAAIGNGAAFSKGRDFAAWLGLVPKQMSTGDRTILGRISKGRPRYSAQTGKLDKAQLWTVAHSRGETAASQRSSDCSCQQAGADRLDGLGARPQLRIACDIGRGLSAGP